MLLPSKKIILKDPTNNQIIDIRNYNLLSYHPVIGIGYEMILSYYDLQMSNLTILTVRFDGNHVIQQTHTIIKTIPDGYILLSVFFEKNSEQILCGIVKESNNVLDIYALTPHNDEITAGRAPFFACQVKERYLYNPVFQLSPDKTTLIISSFGEIHLVDLNVFSLLKKINIANIKGLILSSKIVDKNKIYILSRGKDIRNDDFYGSIFCLDSNQWLIQELLIKKVERIFLGINVEGNYVEDTTNFSFLSNGCLVLREPNTETLVYRWDIGYIEILSLGWTNQFSTCELLDNGHLLLNETNFPNPAIGGNLKILDPSFSPVKCAHFIPLVDEIMPIQGNPPRQALIINVQRHLGYYENKLFSLSPETNELCLVDFPNIKSITWNLTIDDMKWIKEKEHSIQLLSRTPFENYSLPIISENIERLIFILNSSKLINLLKRTIYSKLSFFKLIFCYAWIRDNLNLEVSKIPSIIRLAYASYREHGISDPRKKMLDTYFDDFAYYTLNKPDYDDWRKKGKERSHFPDSFKGTIRLLKPIIDILKPRVNKPLMLPTYNITRLPVELLIHIASFLDFKNLIELNKTCRVFRSITYGETPTAIQLFLNPFPYIPPKKETTKEILKIIEQKTALSKDDVFILINFLRDGRLSVEELTLHILTNTSEKMKDDFLTWLKKIYAVEQGRNLKYKTASAPSS